MYFPSTQGDSNAKVCQMLLKRLPYLELGSRSSSDPVSRKRRSGNKLHVVVPMMRKELRASQMCVYVAEGGIREPA